MLGRRKHRLAIGAAALCAAPMLAGCTFSDSLKPEEIRSTWALPAPAVQDIVFTTDREPDGSRLGYGLHWDAKTHCGAVQLSIPGAGGDPATAEVPRTIDCDGAAAMDGLAEAIAAAAKGCNRVLVVVHGYNTVFRTGLLRAGQVATDTQWHCATLLFSWSSAGKFDRYAADIERSGYAVPVLIAVLRALHKAGLQTDIFAHSMGARVALSATAALCSETPGRIADEMVLPAPDVGAEPGNDDFGHFLRGSGACVRRVTVYASDNDMALVASEAAHGGVPRAGRTPKLDMQYVGRGFGNIVDVVDTGQAPGDPYGHGYYALSYELMHDAMLVLAGTDIAQRQAGGTVTCGSTCVPGRGPYALVVADDRKPDWTSSLMRWLWPFIPRVQ
jgi:esterase/lipase superfamily enzyme